MPSTREWVLLSYRLPREPSTPRIALWRRLRRLGAAQLGDGLVALPLDARTREHLDWAAGHVTESGGEAQVWIAQPATAADEESVVRRMADAVAADYRAVIEAAAAGEQNPSRRPRTIARLRRTLNAIRARDYFPPPERELATRAVEELASLVEAAP